MQIRSLDVWPVEPGSYNALYPRLRTTDGLEELDFEARTRHAPRYELDRGGTR